ncbi:endonuclease [Faecalibacter rhinopitheci]|uniref:Endonuclease n=1 Tax=Faecalibacter rhinopitheci TaxID=2779678 RepID=A0A8J7FSE7_9FLAO|nr:endonuclease [Faecalibacter rhinopitheci]MBF0595871.1 endonuclease [Faecalibacter rhinopitheci]
MRKILLNITLTSLCSLAFGQVPNGYYDSATGDGFELKTQLYHIIKNHTTKTYANLWGLYTGNPSAFNDNWYDSTDTNKIMDIYSEKPQGQDAYTFIPGTNQCGGSGGNEGTCYNREHLIPQSVFNQNSPMVSDPFHIWPTDYQVNNRRANYPFGVVKNPTWTSTNGSKLGPNNNSGYSEGYSGVVFEPIDEFKGDIARAYFYFATRYQENGIQNWNYPMFNGTKDLVFTTTFLKILMNWHTNDPVSPREIALNNTIYTFQNNRNPFIDYPEYAQKIWGYNLSNSDFEHQERNEINVYKSGPNTISVISNNDNKIIEIHIFNINGQFINKIANVKLNNKVDISLNNKGTYIFKIIGKSMEINKKVVL